MRDVGKKSEHMKGLCDISQHRCITHIESNRCMGEPSRHTICDVGKKSEHMKGLGDISQHRCMTHLESNRCMSEQSRYTMGDVGKNLNI